MIEELKALLTEANQELSSASDDAHVEATRIKYLGKKGSLSAVLRGMSKLSAE
ncbi:MAG: phenylalanine--tRNA ligase subunit alpha, partial [Myxococcales bacterium]